MASGQHKAPADAKGWVTIADREAGNLQGSYIGKLSNDAKCDHALRAIEAMLKAILWKVHGWSAWPKRENPTNYLYNHNLEAMMAHCGSLKDELQKSPDHWASWQTLLTAIVRQYRYLPTAPSDTEANQIARSCRHPDFGVLPWLRQYYHKLT